MDVCKCMWTTGPPWMFKCCPTYSLLRFMLRVFVGLYVHYIPSSRQRPEEGVASLELDLQTGRSHHLDAEPKFSRRAASQYLLNLELDLGTISTSPKIKTTREAEGQVERALLLDLGSELPGSACPHLSCTGTTTTRLCLALIHSLLRQVSAALAVLELQNKLASKSNTHIHLPTKGWD